MYIHLDKFLRVNSNSKRSRRRFLVRAQNTFLTATHTHTHTHAHASTHHLFSLFSRKHATSSVRLMLDGSIFFVEFVDRAVNLPTLNFISRRSREHNGQVTATNRILPNRHVFSFFFSFFILLLLFYESFAVWFVFFAWFQREIIADKNYEG